MIGDNDLQYTTPEYDENGELIPTIPTEDVDENTEVEFPDVPQDFYESTDTSPQENAIIEVDEFEIIDEELSVISEARSTKSDSKSMLVELLTGILEKGEMTEEDSAELDFAKEIYNSSVSVIKQTIGDVDVRNNIINIEELKSSMVGASVDDILNILTDEGRKPWLYKDSKNNVLVDMTAIPELSVAVNKLNLIAQTNESTGQITLSPEFIQMIVSDTGIGSTITSIVHKYYLSTSKTELVGGSWVTGLPTTQEQQGKFLWYKIVTLYKNGQTTETEPVCITGQDGENGVSATEIVLEYAKNTSTSTPPTSTWGTSMPTYEEGYYLWRRTRIKWSNKDSYEYSTPVLDETWKAVGTVKTEFTQTLNGFKQEVSSTYTTKQELNKLNISDRNFILKSNMFTSSSTTGICSASPDFINTFNNNLGGTLIISVEGTTIDAVCDVNNKYKRFGCEVTIVYEDGTNGYIGVWEYLDTTPSNYSNKRISRVFNIPNKKVSSVYAVGVYVQGLASGEVRVGRPKLQFSDKLTIWTPAPEDIEKDLSKVEQTANKINWLVQSGTSQSNMTLTNELFSIISNNIVLRGKQIEITGDTIITGLVTANESFTIQPDGSVTATDITVQNTVSANVLVGNELTVPWHDVCLTQDITVYVNSETTYPDEYADGLNISYLADGVRFSSFSDLLGVVPRNLNGYKLRIVMETDITETIEFKGVGNGHIQLDMTGHTLKGWIWIEGFNGLLFRIYGDTNSSTGGAVRGKIIPNLGVSFSSFRYCLLAKWTKIYIYDIDFYKGNATDKPNNCICLADFCTGYLNYVAAINNPNSLLRCHSATHAYVSSSSGTTESTVFQSVSGSIIHVNNTNQAGRANSSAHLYTNDNAQIFADGAKYDTVTQSGNNTNNNTQTETSKTVTIKSTTGKSYRTSGTYAGSWSSDNVVRQGRWTSSLGSNTGCWFFGTQLSSIFENSDNTIKSVKIKITRQTGGSSSNVTHYLRVHTNKSKPSGAPSLLGTGVLDKSFSLATGQSTTLSLSASEIKNIVNNRATGFGLYTSSTAQGSYSCCSPSLTVTITYTTKN